MKNILCMDFDLPADKIVEHDPGRAWPLHRSQVIRNIIASYKAGYWTQDEAVRMIEDWLDE